MIDYLVRTFPALGEMHVYEPSPTQPGTGYIRKHSSIHTGSFYSTAFNPERPGDLLRQDLQSLSFADDCFDLVVSQDVFEHIADPRKAFAEVSRVLKPGGSHVFTIPWYPDQKTEPRAEIKDDKVHHLQAPEYHSDPYDYNGSLVFTRFGSDTTRIIMASSGMQTSVTKAEDYRKGIYGESLYIFHSINPTG